jgi:hypothetical protein
MPTKLPLREEGGIRERVVAPVCGMYVVPLVVVPMEGNAAFEPIRQVTPHNPYGSNLR